jgi:hypothetical protein
MTSRRIRASSSSKQPSTNTCQGTAPCATGSRQDPTSGFAPQLRTAKPVNGLRRVCRRLRPEFPCTLGCKCTELRLTLLLLSLKLSLPLLCSRPVHIGLTLGSLSAFSILLLGTHPVNRGTEIARLTLLRRLIVRLHSHPCWCSTCRCGGGDGSWFCCLSEVSGLHRTGKRGRHNDSRWCDVRWRDHNRCRNRFSGLCGGTRSPNDYHHETRNAAIIGQEQYRFMQLLYAFFVQIRG